MNSLLFIFLQLFSSFVFAEKFSSTVDSLDPSERSTGFHLIKFSDGHVAFLDAQDKLSWEAFRVSMVKGDLLDVELDEEGTYIEARTVEFDVVKQSEQVERDYREKFSYDPTNLESSHEAMAIFRRMNRHYQDESQCYNRAHVWTYEEFKRSGLRSQKLFLFFTSRYIRHYRYKWWFHVTPMVLVKSQMMAMDFRYTRRPFELKTWTDIFIYSKRSCPIVYKYSSYANHQLEEDCYLIPVSMYFWQPRDIAFLERTGFQKTQFISSEIRHAYSEAF